MELFDGEGNSYEHQLQWYSTTLPCRGTISWNLKLGVLVGKMSFILGRQKIYVIITYLCAVHTYKVIPGFLQFCMERGKAFLQILAGNKAKQQLYGSIT